MLRFSDTIFIGVRLLETFEIIPTFWQYNFSLALISLTRVARLHTLKIIIYGFPSRLSSRSHNICRGVCSRGGKIHKLFIKNNRDTGVTPFIHLNV